MRENKIKEHPVFNNPIFKNYKCDGQLMFTEEDKILKIVEEPKNKSDKPSKFV